MTVKLGSRKAANFVATTRACQHGTTPQKVWGRKVYGVRQNKIKIRKEN